MKANGLDRIDVTPLREAFERSGRSLSDVAYELGWTQRWADGHTVANTSKVARTLGMMMQANGKGTRYMQRTVSYDMAVRLVRAIDCDPVDVGV